MKSIYFFLLILLSVEARIHEKVLICGVARDVESSLPKTIRIIEDLGKKFTDYTVLVYENNSQDNTPQLLKNWSNKNSKVKCFSEVISDEDYSKIIVNKTWDKRFYRPERIAYARNKILDHIEKDKFNDFKFVIWIDMDFRKKPIMDGLKEAFDRKKEWDAIFCYGVDSHGKYFDWFALRDDNYPVGPELLSDDWWSFEKKLKLNTSQNWHPVYSAFGGMGIYKRDAIKGCRYSAVVTEDLDCLYSRIIKNGKVNSNYFIRSYFDKNQGVDSSFLSLSDASLKESPYGHPYSLYFSDLKWRMNSGVSYFPVVCEHVTFHASMIKNGYNRLYINPGIVFFY
jgi:hypothetical protein